MGDAVLPPLSEIPAFAAGLVPLAALGIGALNANAARAAALAAAMAGPLAIGLAGMAEAAGRPELVLGGLLAAAGGVLAFAKRSAQPWV
jgi:hypothetical protein